MTMYKDNSSDILKEILTTEEVISSKEDSDIEMWSCALVRTSVLRWPLNVNFHRFICV